MTLISVLKEEKLDELSWMLPGRDVDSFMRHRVRNMVLAFSIGLIVLLGTLIFTKNYFNVNAWVLGLMLLIGMIFLVYKSSFFILNSKFKAKRKEVYESFPLWVSTLEILIVTNNITNTFKKSIPTCPAAFRSDLEEFVKQIEFNPENKDLYRNFLRKYNLDDVTEVILDMYAFNNLNKNQIVEEFKHINKRLNKIQNNIRVNRQNMDLMFIGSLNSMPLMITCVYSLLVCMLMNAF